MKNSSKFKQAEDSLRLIEDYISTSYDGIDFKGPNIGQDIGAPPQIQDPIDEGSDLFLDAVHTTPDTETIRAGRDEISLEDYKQLTEDLEESIQCYEEAVNTYLNEVKTKDILDFDELMREAKASEGAVEEESMYEVAGIDRIRHDSLEEGEREVKMRFDDTQDATEKIKELGYNLNNIVETRFERELKTFKENINAGLAEYQSLIDQEISQKPIDYEPQINTQKTV